MTTSRLRIFLAAVLTLAISYIFHGNSAEAADIIRTIGNQNVTCRPSPRGMIAGTSRQVKKGRKKVTVFTPFSAQISKMNRQVKGASGSKKQKLKNKLTALKALSSAAKSACDAAGNNPGGGGTPIPVELSLDPLSRPMTSDDVYFLMERAGYGFNPKKHQYLLGLAASGGVQAVVNDLMTVRPEVPGLESRIIERLDDNLAPGTTRRTNYTLWGMREAAVEYALHTNNPVLVRLADETFFNKWTVNERVLTNQRQYELFWDYRKLLRRYAMQGGTMRDLLLEISKHPMMLWFLDNGSSTAGNPNENYAREIQELYSMGRERWADNCSGKVTNYVEQQDGLRVRGDIFQATLALTGWTVIDREIDGERFYRSVYSAGDHRQGPKILYRGTPHERTVEGMEDVVEAIMNHPGTAQGLATDLLKAYVMPDPPCLVVLEFARIIRAQSYDLRAAVTTLLKSNLFYNRAYENTIIKSPLHRIAQLVNILGLTYSTEDLTLNNEIGVNISWVVGMLENQSMTINSPPTVFSYDQDAWIAQRAFTAHANLVGDLMVDGSTIRRLANTGTEQQPLYFDWWRPSGEMLARNVIQDIAARLRVPLNDNQLSQIEYFLNHYRQWDNPSIVHRSIYDNVGDESHGKLIRLYMILTALPPYLTS